MKANLAFFATPKTGSTAYHVALRRYADIALVNQTRVKHISLRKYRAHMLPFLQGAYGVTPECVAVMRNPLEQARSWYSYRRRPKTEGMATSTHDMSFDEFLRAASEDSPPQFAQIGSQAEFLSDAGALAVDHLFAFEYLERLDAFLEARLKRSFETKTYNVSPPTDTTLSAETEALFRSSRAKDFALYEKLNAAGGYLQAET